MIAAIRSGFACRTAAWLGAVLLASVALAVPAPPVQGQTATANPAAVHVGFAAVGAGLRQPVAVVSARDGTGRMFVVEKTGRILVFSGGRFRGVYLDLSAAIRTEGERGLLGLAFHPRFRSLPYLWVSYVDRSANLRIVQLRASTFSSPAVSLATAKSVLVVPHPPERSNHYAGNVVFGPDGYLYISTGDGGGGGDPDDVARFTTNLSGKVLRIDALRACSGRLYCIPPTNPFATARAGREIWVYGLRNPWRFSFDPVTRWLWIGDVGQSTAEEVTVLGTGSGGAYLGWSCREARRTFNAARCATPTGWIDPQVAYGRGVGASVTGGHVYRGRTYASLLNGLYVFGDFVSGRVLVWRFGDGTVYSSGQGLPQVTSFGTDEAGEIWAVTLDGRLWRLRASLR